MGDVLGTLNGFAPLTKAASWDPVGLQIGGLDDRVERVVVCHEVTDSVVRAVEGLQAEMLVTYHPLIFRPLARLVAGSDAAGRALRLARAGVAVAVAHTNLDVAEGGVADALGETLGLRDLAGFAPAAAGVSFKLVTFVPEAAADRVAEAMAAAGAGRIGNYSSCSFRSAGTGTFVPDRFAAPTTGLTGQLNREDELRIEMISPPGRLSAVVSAMLEAHPYEEPAYDVYERTGNEGALGRIGNPPGGIGINEFAGLVAEKLGGPVRLAFAGPDLTRVAVIPGSGSDFIDDALAAGASVLVTGDVPHHRARRAVDSGLTVIDPGHARSERPGMARLAELVGRSGAEVEDLTGLDPTPWEFVT